MTEASLPSTRILDHIIHLAPPGSLEETRKHFSELGFKVVPGGTHTDGLTENALIVLSDSVYLELITFTKPLSAYPPASPERAAREAHPWASKAPGWIDYSFLGTGISDPDPGRRISDILNRRAQLEDSTTEYLQEVTGGRQRADGKLLEWVITSPHERHGRGLLPFFCGDVTPRSWRVPCDPPTNTQHPNAAQGVAHVLLLTVSDLFAHVQRQLIIVLGCSPIKSSVDEAVWELDHPAGTSQTSTSLILRAAKDADEVEFASARTPVGVYEIAIWLDAGADRRKGVFKTPYGRILLCPVDLSV